MSQGSGSDVVVIGAGAVGLAVALQLRRLGAGSVTVVEAFEGPGLGSSSRANGGVRAQFSTAINIEFSRFSIARLAELDEATGGLCGLRQVGYLFMAGADRAVAALRSQWELQRSLGLDVRWLDPREVLELAPFVDPAGLVCGTFCPTDGTIDPGGVVSALWLEGRRLGAAYRFSERVIGLEFGPSGCVVRTTGGEHGAAAVVNAAGPQARAVAALAGLDLPVHPYRRNLANTEPVAGYPDPTPMCVDLDTGVLIRREAGGFLIAYSDPADEPSTDTTFDPRFLEAVAERIGHRFPFLETVPIDDRKCWAGLYPETADHHAIIDRSPGLEAFVQCVGMGGHGIMHSLAAGTAAAELILRGTCTTFDLRPFRLARFAEGDLTIELAVL